MGYGVKITNNSGQLLLSTDLENLHFGGKATLTGNDGGGYNKFALFKGTSNKLDGRVIYTYTFTSVHTPLIFIKPGNYSLWHSIVTQKKVGTTWTIDVLQSSTSTGNPPELYCFVPPASLVPPAGETYGLKLLKTNGDVSFDSRLNPLAITGGGTGKPPTCPVNGGYPTTTTKSSVGKSSRLDWDFGSSKRYTSYAISGTLSNLMFAAPSLPQAVYKRRIDATHDYFCIEKGCRGEWPQQQCWYYSSTCYEYSAEMWWVMYRGAFRLRSGYFDFGWGVYTAGYAYADTQQDGWWIGLINPPTTSVNIGTTPYQDKSINMVSSAYIVADSSIY